MARRVRKVSKKIGLTPGSVVYVGEDRAEKVAIDLIEYDERNYTERRVENIDQCFPLKESPVITWINVGGIHEVEIIEKIGQHLNINPLVLEDLVNTGHRPKMEDAGNNIFVLLKMLYEGKQKGELKTEQVGIIFGDNFVCSFQESGRNVFEVIRDRIKRTVPRVRFMNADYLAYTLMDAVVDHYFLVLEQVGERVEALEDRLVNNPEPKNLEIIHSLKRELILTRKAVWPLREVIGGLDRLETPLVRDTTGPYLRDLYEHTIQVIDTVETYRDMVSGLLDIYLSSVSNRMNEVMKVLTIIATIFIPLGFLAGVYGMNFDTSISPFNMPELSIRYGYVVFWAVVLLLASGMVWFFRRKRWL